MNSVIIFEEQMPLYLTVFSLFFFMFCGIYLCVDQKETAVLKGIKYMIGGFVVDFVSSWFASMMGELTATVGPELLTITALFIKLIILILCVMAATNIIWGKSAGIAFSVLVGLLGAAGIVFWTHIEPNEALVNVMYNLYPAIGFLALATAFITRCFGRYNMGYIVGCITLAWLTYITALSITPVTIFSIQIWYTGLVGYLGLGTCSLLILIDMKNDNIDKLNKKMSKYDQRMKEIIKLSPFPIIIARLSDDTILSTNDSFLKMFNISHKELEYLHFKDFFVDQNNRRLLSSHLEKERIVKDFEILVKSPKSESPFWLSTSANVIDYDYDVALYAAFQDITDRKKREEILKTQATRDPLTSLYNRRYFEEEVNRRIRTQPDSKFCVFMIDADHFKNVNDTYGHKVGDKVLMALASTAQQALRDKDIVARYGGEEFVVYLAESNSEEAKSVADRLRESIAELTVYSDANEPFHFTVSIGISTSNDSRNLGELIKMSDDALYEAKESGRNRCIIYHTDTPSEPETVKAEKAEENVHPAFAKNNDVEVSLLEKEAQEPKGEA